MKCYFFFRRLIFILWDVAHTSSWISKGCIKKEFLLNLILLWSNLNTNFDSARPLRNLFISTLFPEPCIPYCLMSIHSGGFQVLPLLSERPVYIYGAYNQWTPQAESSLISLEFLISPVEDTQLL